MSKDDRVISLSLRFFGNLISTSDIFDSDNSHQIFILDYILDFSIHSFIVKYACLEAINLLFDCDIAKAWLLCSTKLCDILFESISTTNYHISRSSARLIAHLISCCSLDMLKTNLLFDNSFLNLLYLFIHSDSLQDDQMTALEVIWNLLEFGTTESLLFLESSRLVFNY